MKALRSLAVDSNRLTGTLPSEIGLLTNMETLHIQGLRVINIGLDGALPNEIGLLENLQSFFLPDNYVTRTVPSTLSLLTNLWRLWA
jgi:Leucine-rich repeat (LRR) protein